MCQVVCWWTIMAVMVTTQRWNGGFSWKWGRAWPPWNSWGPVLGDCKSLLPLTQAECKVSSFCQRWKGGWLLGSWDLLVKIACKMLIETLHQCSLPKKGKPKSNTYMSLIVSVPVLCPVLCFPHGLTKVVVNDSGIVHIVPSKPLFQPESPSMQTTSLYSSTVCSSILSVCLSIYSFRKHPHL